MIRGIGLLSVTLLLLGLLASAVSAAPPEDCGFLECEVQPFPYAEQSTAAEHVNVLGYKVFSATNNPPVPQFYTYYLVPYCVQNDDTGEQCEMVPSCAAGEGQLNLYYYIYRQPIAQPAGTLPPPEYGDNEPPAQAPPPGVAIGQAYGEMTLWLEGCVDVSSLDLPPSPEEVATYFQALPLPGLGFGFQPPDLGLVNLPEIFFTLEPTTGSYVVDIRGYSVSIYAGVSQFFWHTGDTASPEGEYVYSQDPGAPYPNHTVTHTYLQRGTYPAYLQTVWVSTYTYDGNGPYAVPGSVVTIGPTQNIDVVEAHPVLTDPYD